MQSNKNRMLHIVTRCSRINNIIRVGESIPVKDDGIQWHVIFDANVLKDVSTDILSTLQRDYNAKLYFEYSQNDYLYTRMNNVIIDNIKDGWVYGEVKDAEKKTHPCLVPFDQLPLFQQKKDKLFCAIVDALR
jgi:hypothetical protein